MTYLKFDKALMVNLQQSLTKELLQTNKSGAYSYSTIVDCNTRKYHGLLVIPVPELDGKNHVLISSLDTTVIQHGAEFNLGLHKYEGDNYSPQGHKYIREFECDSNPSTIYRVGGVILSKEKIFVSHENRMLIKYTLLEAHSPTKLRLRPFLAFRSINDLCKENNYVNKEYQLVDNGIKLCLYNGYPELHMQLSAENEFHYSPDWYRNIEYLKEQERGYDFKEDLFVPGYFELPIKKDESIYFSAGISVIQPATMQKMFEEEKSIRTPRNSFTNSLKNAAYQFYNKHPDGQRYLLAGYPWFECRARDMFVSLPGCTLAAEDPGLFDAIMETGEKGLRNFMEHKPIDCAITEIDAPDVLLWMIWALQQYAKDQGTEKCAGKYNKLLFDALDFIIGQKHDKLILHNNGLLFTNGKEQPVSWMNSMMYGKPLVPRTGYLVEFNALWYNALCFASEMAALAGKAKLQAKYSELAQKAGVSFVEVFRNDFGYLYDFVDGQTIDWSVRPNQIFAVSLDFSPLDKMQKKQVLDIVTKELLTPKGLRTLSPKSLGYNPIFQGSESRRTWAYHQGTAWAWLIGPYVEAYLKVHKIRGLNFAERIIYGFEDDLTDRGIGTISELYDGNPPYWGRGAVSFAMSVAEILRMKQMIKIMSANTTQG
ncbi:MAG TPA: glycogen debranching enzyme N-terminal domain-containing protein [Bacteroidales bacterium]|jgi:predicted glycogen debranching enzyme|nr:glycogen debranching enzyme family protein [Bacteroidales bacterium]OQC02187.1 MAG: Amylo-alpha-1,6-glucosidase [Bacteroidetes bacterium ADurb.Bin090]HNZ80502.1 glycogen debranching enzyme N-terminal domain-containing protein [Bacteroidales bacterium]HOD26880.1 glycogen debranching enzyme N-terminal domain-containing protein [Bacteroidales bacterium]HPB35472.1 glycogen debranching enzyme N-terminal domain-containing protein [Bacteroidales bacterium]